MGCFAIAPYTSWAQGIIVHKTDGSEVRFKATEVERITTYSEEEEPNLPKDVTIQVGDVGLRMIYVEGGVFTMGGTDEQGEDVKAYEEPAHPVKLNSYYIGMTEVTQELWETVMGWNYAWYRNKAGEVKEIFPESKLVPNYVFRTNWVTFYH